MIKKRLAVLTLYFICTSIILSPAHAIGKKEHLQDEQRELIVERLGKFKDLNDVGSKPIGELLDDKAFGEFFEKFGYALTVIQVSDKIASARDKDAIIMIGEEGFKYALKMFYPKVENALGWFTWVKKGMELFKEFVFDPWLFRQQVESYIARRNEGSTPEFAFASLLGWGHIRERALKLLEKQGYNMDLLWVKGEKGVLSEKWEAKLETFIIAEFEMQYARKLIKEAAAKARKELPELERQAHEMLKKKMLEQKAVDEKLTQKTKANAADKKKQDELAPAEKVEKKSLTIESVDVSPKEAKVGETVFLKIAYGVSGLDRDETVIAKSKIIVTGKQKMPFPDQTAEISGKKSRKGIAKSTIEANAAFAKQGDYVWNYTVTIPGLDPLKGSVAFKVNSASSMKREIILKSKDTSPKPGKTQEVVDFKIVYSVRGLTQGIKTPGRAKVVCTGPETVSEPELKMEFDGTKWLSMELVEDEHFVFSKAGQYTCHHELSVEGYQTFKGSFPVSIVQKDVAVVSAPSSPLSGVGGCRATDAAVGGVPGICLACPISIPWNWGESNVPIRIPYKDTGGDITNLQVTSVVSYQGSNQTGTHSFNVANEMRGISGTYNWPGLTDLFAANSTLKLTIFVTDRAGHKSNIAECTMMVLK